MNANPQPGSPEHQSALFATLVMQQSNLAWMLLGKVVHPEEGKVIKDLEAAKLFIDQLEMLETKTKGNLTADEAGLLKQTLTSLRLAFVEAVESPASFPQAAETGKTTEAAPQPGSTPKSEPGPSTQPAGEEPPKKFSKKY